MTKAIVVSRNSDLRVPFALLGVVSLGVLAYIAVPRGEITPASSSPVVPIATVAPQPSASPANVATLAPAAPSAHAHDEPAELPANAPADYPIASITGPTDDKLPPEETLKRKKHAIELLESAISRTQTQLDKATSAGDDAGIHTASIRLQRLRDVLAKRRAELGDAG